MTEANLSEAFFSGLQDLNFMTKGVQILNYHEDLEDDLMEN